MFAALFSSFVSSARLSDRYVKGVSMNFLGFTIEVLVLPESIESSSVNLFLRIGDFFSSLVTDMGSLTITRMIVGARVSDALVQFNTSKM